MEARGSFCNLFSNLLELLWSCQNLWQAISLLFICGYLMQRWSSGYLRVFLIARVMIFTGLHGCLATRWFGLVFFIGLDGFSAVIGLKTVNVIWHHCRCPGVTFFANCTAVNFGAKFSTWGACDKSPCFTLRGDGGKGGCGEMVGFMPGEVNDGNLSEGEGSGTCREKQCKNSCI